MNRPNQKPEQVTRDQINPRLAEVDRVVQAGIDSFLQVVVGLGKAA